jgi:hypothetical protein
MAVSLPVREVQVGVFVPAARLRETVALHKGLPDGVHIAFFVSGTRP